MKMKLEIRFLRFNVNKEFQADRKITDEQNERADNQTDRQKDTHRQSNDRDYDRERASDQEQVRVRKTP